MITITIHVGPDYVGSKCNRLLGLDLDQAILVIGNLSTFYIIWVFNVFSHSYYVKYFVLFTPYYFVNVSYYNYIKYT